MKCIEITGYLEQYAPLPYQEEYDNSGLLTGSYGQEITGILIALDINDDIIEEAVNKGFNMIVAHHPFIFRGIKRVTGNSMAERILIRAIKNDIAIYAIHTNIDNVHNGLNSILAEKIGISGLRILSPAPGLLNKLVTFCPKADADRVREAIFASGAGQIGDYDSCSYNIEGKGSFRAGEGTDPYVGEKGKIHFEDETRIETIFPAHLKEKVVSAMIDAHPYEEVAYDIYPLANMYDRVGAGMIGTLEKPLSVPAFLKVLKNNLNLSTIRHTSFKGKEISKVAVCGGSGSQLVNHAIQQGADAFVTADIKYHQFFDVDNRLLLADIGHYESEQFVSELILKILKEKFTNFALQITDINTNPVNYYI